MKSASPSRYALRMSLFYGSFFLPFGIYIPFAGVWLKSLGMSAEAIGFVLMVPMIARVIFTPFMAALADKLGDRRLALLIYCIAYALSFALITLDDSLAWIILIMAISHIAQSAIIPVADSLAMAGTRRYDLDYGRMRSWGSMAFLAANLIGGAFLDAFGAGPIIWLMVAGNMLQIVFSFLLPQDPRLIDNKHLTKGTKLDWSQLRQFVQSGFWVVLFATSLVQASHGLLYAFASIYWEQRSVTASMIGVLWSASILAEVILFVYSKQISARFSWKMLMMIGAAFSILRWILFPFDVGMVGYLLLQMLHAASFGCSHLGLMFFISELVDDELSGTAQGLFAMLSGLLLAIATYISGLLYADMGGNAFFVMAAIVLVALIMLATSGFFSLGRIRVDTEQQP